ncbi:MAG: hypothetical protein LC768_14810 [Acidobacteria bacterium]|nr:hypothetical protein [Acidobacteriota bacterium]MCA1639578.1 hypothetical protein [Acidobacteriota bacterium]
MPYTLGFGHPLDLTSHFGDHVVLKKEFPHIMTEAEYLYYADKFLGEPLNPKTTKQCKRFKRDGIRWDWIRYNKVTHEYGILSQDNVILSYYIANPLEHGWKTNLDYFNWDCKRKKKR